MLVNYGAVWNSIGKVIHVNLHAPNQVLCVAAGTPGPGGCQYGKACFNIKGCNKKHPVEEICVLVDTCIDYHCNKRHSKQRPRPCNFGLKCKKNGSCQFLHPSDHCAGSSSANNNGQLATVKFTPAPVKPTTKMLKFTGFGHQIDDFTVAGQKLQNALRSLVIRKLTSTSLQLVPHKLALLALPVSAAPDLQKQQLSTSSLCQPC